MSDRQASANYPHPILAREGWLFIFFAIAATAAVHFFFGFLPATPFWLLSVFIIQFFRDPPRTVAGDSGCVVAPADGRVTAIEHANDPYLNREAIKVSVFMNVFNVHSQRSPVDGLVKARWYYKGKFFNAALDKASTENERNALHIVTDNGYDIVCVQVAGLVARRILCFVEPDTHLVRGERYGFIRFGSRLDLYLPMTARVKVGLGQKVSAASTIIAELS